MTYRVFTLFFLFITILLQAQESVVTGTFTLKEGENRVFLIPAEKGDTLKIDLQREKGPRIAVSTLKTLSGVSVFTEEKIKSLQKIIPVAKRQIYELTISNTASKEMRFQVEAKVATLRSYTLQIDYKVQRDTTYAYRTTRWKTVKKEVTQSLQTEKFYVNSRSNSFIKGGKDRVFFPVFLPPETVSWWYVFTASRNESDIENTLNTFNLAGTLTKYLDEDTSLQNAVLKFNTPPGANICDIYVLDEDNARRFGEKSDFIYNVDLSRENYKSGVVAANGYVPQKIYMGIRNPDNVYGIHVAVEIIAVVKTFESVEEEINIPVIVSKQVPYIRK
ncbi:hypothetical protein [Ascidiimonas aurantiaca]|uniref:hypothetical protein n=1 Tax=Ascidiimonas aurantiaca TaxID=1685432 RepID=UPI0030EB3F7D